MGLAHKAVVGQHVEFLTKTGDKLAGKVIRVAGEVYTVKLGQEETRPVHQKYLTKIITAIQNSDVDARMRMHGEIIR